MYVRNLKWKLHLVSVYSFTSDFGSSQFFIFFCAGIVTIFSYVCEENSEKIVEYFFLEILLNIQLVT